MENLGLATGILVHADYGGITSARHLIAYRNVDPFFFVPRTSLPCTLVHIIDPAVHTRGVEVQPTRQINEPSRIPIWDMVGGFAGRHVGESN